ncbi:hypothetical protein KC717_06050, partial [Candidatus Dojkabacteria bacterium]|nr:hypothetical protein [Candidatus Dojkabacteria bacterium]
MIEINFSTIVYSVGGGLVFFLVLFRYLFLRRTVRETIPEKDRVVLKISIPRHNEKSPLAAEQLYSSLHGIVKSAAKSPDHFSFEIVAGSYGIFFMVVTAKRYKRFVENQIFAQYPEAQIQHIRDYAASLKTIKSPHALVELSLVKDTFLPIRTFQNFDVDPLASITGAISKLSGKEQVWIQLVTRPIGNQWQSVGKGYVDKRKQKTDSEGQKVALESGENTELSEIEKKNTKVGFQFTIRVLAQGPDITTLQAHLDDAVASFKQFQTPHLNSIGPRSKKKTIFTSIRKILLGRTLDDKLSVASRFEQRFLDEKEQGIITIEELASLYHLPSKAVETPNIAWAMSKKLEYPLNVPTKEQKARLYGLTDYR